MALWHKSPQLGTRRDIHITNFQINQNFTVSELRFIFFIDLSFLQGIYD
jgi:hypothetical protein